VKDGNPFRKGDFATAREWEQALIFFLLEQLRSPDPAAWHALAADEESRLCAAFMAHQLSNIALVRRMPSEPLLASVFPALMGRAVELQDLRAWFAMKWIDQSRLHATLDAALRQGVARETHSLLAG
jgi:hypothetical protein